MVKCANSGKNRKNENDTLVKTEYKKMAHPLACLGGKIDFKMIFFQIRANF